MLFTNKVHFWQLRKIIIFFVTIISSCTSVKNSLTTVKKYQKGKPFIYDNIISLLKTNLDKSAQDLLITRLYNQLDDSSKVTTKDKLFVFHTKEKPPAFDTIWASKSAQNMNKSMHHIGYYSSSVYYKADTIFSSHNQQRVTVNYFVNSGNPTLIDTVKYGLKVPTLLEINNKYIHKSLLQKNEPVSKSAVIGEVNRLVDIFRNNGFYKFSSDELIVRGDTTQEILSNITDDLEEQFALLAKAKAAKDSPKIKLAILLKPIKDSSKIRQYYINNIYILPDYISEKNNDIKLKEEYIKQKFCKKCTADTVAIIQYRYHLFTQAFLLSKLFIKKGDLYNQTNFNKTLNSFAKAGVWRSSNIFIKELVDSNKIDLIIQLSPNRKFSFESNVEANYSFSSGNNNSVVSTSGNLFGIQGSSSLLNRNFQKQGIKMLNSISSGVELNFSADSSRNLINSNNINFTNTLVFPKFIFPIKAFNKNEKFIDPSTNISTNLGLINKINLYNLETINFGIGYSWISKKNRQWLIKPLNIEFTRLSNESQIFRKILDSNQFLKYSFNTALVAGSSITYKSNKINLYHPNRHHSLKINVEESGFPLFIIPLRTLNVLPKYLKQFLKTDVEYIFTSTKPKSEFAFRAFGGFGTPSKKDATLPFFKQYFGGGSNSMRGWPIRGIGQGSQSLNTYPSSFNDKTGDIQLETNLEYRYNIMPLFSNFISLKGAFFVDAGNIWNFRNTNTIGTVDKSQFKFQNIYKQLGVDAGFGMRFDFSNYFLVRFDLGFRFKRPDLSETNAGWLAPNIGFDDMLQKIFSRNKKEWRYNNMNFTLGISYPF